MAQIETYHAKALLQYQRSEEAVSNECELRDIRSQEITEKLTEYAYGA